MKSNSILIITILLTTIAGVDTLARGTDEPRDPTRPLFYSVGTVAGPDLTLQAIVTRQGQHHAMVNGQRVRAGDRVEGARIDYVGDNRVVYSFAGQQKTLVLRPSLINKR